MNIWPASMFTARESPPPVTPVPEALRGDGAYALPVVGESKYQEALDDICGGHTRDGHCRKASAILVLEDGNRHDPKAVRVDIGREPVGYLTRDKARKYRGRLQDLGVGAGPFSCPAEIRGGFLRDGPDGVGYYGVWLDLYLSKARPRK